MDPQIKCGFMPCHSDQSCLTGILTAKFFYWSASLLAKADVNRVGKRK
jgi:hypothetical protein